jgi:hypothetical protein
MNELTGDLKFSGILSGYRSRKFAINGLRVDTKVVAT